MGRIALKPATVNVRGHVHVSGSQTTTTTVATGQGQVSGGAQVVVEQPPPPPPPPVLVSIVDAPVPEFFGIPLENAQDVVFVLDVSGSMNGAAHGRMTEVTTTTTPEPVPTSPPPTSPPPPSQPPPGSAWQPATPPPPVGPSPAGGPPPPRSQAAASDPGVAPTTDTTTTTTTRTLSKIEVAKIELVSALQRLPPGTRLNVLFFNSDLEAYGSGLFGIDENLRADLIAYVEDQNAFGSTALGPAMRTAFVMNAKHVVLLSDGLGNVGGGAREILRDAREAMRGGVRIDTIGIGYSDADLLEQIARESGGLYQGL